MGKKRISFGPGSKITIKRNTSSSEDDTGDDQPSQPDDPHTPDTQPSQPDDPHTPDTQPSQPDDPHTPDTQPDQPTPSTDRLTIPQQLLADQATLLTESQVRPHDKTDPDIEVLYLMSGDNKGTVEDVHGMSSDQVIVDADSTSISWSGKVIEYLDEELECPPELILMNHTHPNGTIRPSSTDLSDGWPSFERSLRNKWPQTRVLFGIHALQREFSCPKKASQPEVRGDTIKWQSTKRPHKFRVYSKSGDPVNLEVI